MKKDNQKNQKKLRINKSSIRLLSEQALLENVQGGQVGGPAQDFFYLTEPRN